MYKIHIENEEKDECQKKCDSSLPQEKKRN